MWHFLGPKYDPFVPSKTFLGKIINVIFIYLLTPLIIQNFKKILPVEPEL